MNGANLQVLLVSYRRLFVGSKKSLDNGMLKFIKLELMIPTDSEVG